MREREKICMNPNLYGAENTRLQISRSFICIWTYWCGLLISLRYVWYKLLYLSLQRHKYFRMRSHTRTGRRIQLPSNNRARTWKSERNIHTAFAIDRSVCLCVRCRHYYRCNNFNAQALFSTVSSFDLIWIGINVRSRNRLFVLFSFCALNSNFRKLTKTFQMGILSQKS